MVYREIEGASHGYDLRFETAQSAVPNVPNSSSFSSSSLRLFTRLASGLRAQSADFLNEVPGNDQDPCPLGADLSLSATVSRETVSPSHG